MKGTYIVVFIGAIVVLTILTVVAVSQLTSPEDDYQTIVRDFNWFSAGITFINLCATTVLLVLAHLIIYRKRMKGKGVYLLLSLPYLLFITFTLVNYLYIYELYNVFQEVNNQPIDTPDMDVFALNLALFAFIIGGINVGLVGIMKKGG